MSWVLILRIKHENLGHLECFKFRKFNVLFQEADKMASEILGQILRKTHSPRRKIICLSIIGLIFYFCVIFASSSEIRFHYTNIPGTPPTPFITVIYVEKIRICDSFTLFIRLNQNIKVKVILIIKRLFKNKEVSRKNCLVRDLIWLILPKFVRPPPLPPSPN
jgi:hypothetical protein